MGSNANLEEAASQEDRFLESTMCIFSDLQVATEMGTASEGHWIPAKHSAPAIP